MQDRPVLLVVFVVALGLVVVADFAVVVDKAVAAVDTVAVAGIHRAGTGKAFALPACCCSNCFGS